MTERAIILKADQIKTAREGKRTHLCLAKYPRIGQQAGRSVWASLAAGDRLWVKEEAAHAIDTQRPLNSQAYYRVDLLGGWPPLPTWNGHTNNGRWRRQYVDAFHMLRESSRYTLKVIAVRDFNAQDIEWDEIKAEGGVQYATDSKGQWWKRNYPSLPWLRNPAVIGFTFEFLAESIDGVPAKDWRKPVGKENAALAAMINEGPKKEDPPVESGWHMRNDS